MGKAWVDFGPSAVSRRYDHLAPFFPMFDCLLFVPPGFRRRAAERLALGAGDRVLEIGCGTGRNFQYLHDAVGASGRIHGVDISAGMLNGARRRCARQGWHNVDLIQEDAVNFVAPAPLDGVLFGLSYNTIAHHLAVLRRAWRQLCSGGRMVIMDAKLPPGEAGKLLLPFSLWLMRMTLLGNPHVRPWEHLEKIAGGTEMEEFLFGSYYICSATKT